VTLAHYLCAAMGQFYIKAQLSVKRERSNAKVIHLFMCCFRGWLKCPTRHPSSRR
jgi:hypothetical protein